MRVIFLGSPAEVLPVLSACEPHLVAVISKPAKAKGRKKQLIDPAVAAHAKERWPDLPVLQPASAKDPDFIAEVAALKPDIMVTAAYGEILTEEFIGLASRAVINVHPSLLPLYRGATPVPAALLAGDTVTGVSILFTVKALDAGNIIVQEPLDIGPAETAEQLLPRSFEFGAELLPEAFAKLADPGFTGIPQDPDAISHCQKIHKSDGAIDWYQQDHDIYNRFRAFQPWPGVFTHSPKGKVIVTAMSSVRDDGPGEANCSVVAKLPADLSERQPGEFIFVKPLKALAVATAGEPLLIHRLKPEGAKDQDAAGFWNGLKAKGYQMFASKKLRVAVAVSGTGRSLANMLKRQQDEDACYEVTSVISSHAQCKANDIAVEHGLPLLQRGFSAKEQTEAAAALRRWLRKHPADVIFLAGFIKKFPDLGAEFSGTILNIHPALLPKFGGKGMYGDRVHQEVSKSGDEVTGATIHLVTANYDEGHIIAQIKVAITPGDEPGKIAAQVFAKECIMVPDTLNRLAQGALPLPDHTVWMHPDSV